MIYLKYEELSFEWINRRGRRDRKDRIDRIDRIHRTDRKDRKIDRWLGR